MSATTSPHLVILFDVVVFLGVILFACTLLPAIFSKGVQRTIGWHSLMIAWLVFSLSYGLIVGRQAGPEPPLGLCLMQTLLVYACPTLVSTGTLCYYIEFYLTIAGLKSGNLARRPNAARTFLLVAIPWLVFLGIIIELLVLIYPGNRLHLVERASNNFYCHLGDDLPSKVTGFVIVSGSAILIPLEVRTGLMMYKNWDVFKRLSRTDRHIVLTVYLRLTLCTLAAAIAFAFSTVAVVFPAPDATSLVYPFLSIFVGLAFGTQKDLLRAWLFWRPTQPYGSIVFNNGTVLTTNVMTSRGAGECFTETQLQHYKHVTVTSLECGTASKDSQPSTSSSSSWAAAGEATGSDLKASASVVDNTSLREQTTIEPALEANPDSSWKHAQSLK